MYVEFVEFVKTEEPPFFSAFLFRASCDRSVAFSTSDTSGFSLVTPESKWAYSYVQQVSGERTQSCFLSTISQ